jgi:hypothetical protein
MRKDEILFIVAIVAVCFALFGNMPVSHAQPAEEGGYAGVKVCANCHGDLAKGWQTTRHAKALETLKKKSQDKLPGCVKCHVTGFEKDGGYVDQELTPELADVQCEACHGPAATHAANPMNKKNLIACPGETVCRECHTTGQDPKFDYASKKRFLHGEDQKGGKP